MTEPKQLQKLSSVDFVNILLYQKLFDLNFKRYYSDPIPDGIQYNYGSGNTDYSIVEVIFENIEITEPLDIQLNTTSGPIKFTNCLFKSIVTIGRASNGGGGYVNSIIISNCTFKNNFTVNDISIGKFSINSDSGKTIFEADLIFNGGGISEADISEPTFSKKISYFWDAVLESF